MSTPRGSTRLARTLSALALLACAAGQAAPISLNNAGFEADWTGHAGQGFDGNLTFTYSPTGANMGWDFGSGTGVANSYSLLTAYEGQRFAFLQMQTQALSQRFTLASMQQVGLDFALALRPRYPAGQVVRVLVDGQGVGDFTASSTGWQLESLSLGTLRAGDHTLAFEGLTGSAGDTSAYLDAVALTGTDVPSGGTVPEPQSLALVATALAGLGALRRRRSA